MNILIIKTGALGDVLRTSFIAQALKDKYKEQNPKIFWITQEKARILFINNPYVDHVLIPKDREKIKDMNFDLLINLEEEEENCKFSSSLNAKNKIGFLYKNGKIIPTETAKEWYDMSALGKKPDNDILKKKNEKTHRQIIGEIVGINWKKYEPFLRLNNKQRELARIFLRRYNLSRSELIVGINLGSADRWPKSLPIKKTALLIDKIYKKYKAKILLFGGPNEIERNREILKLTKSPVIDTGSGNNLFEFPAFVSICNLFITSDSLGLHVALALKRKTICLIGPTSSSEIDMYDLGDKVMAKSKCLCCYKKDCKSMNKISINEVMNKLERLLSQKISLLITSFKEPNISRAIESAMTQKTRYEYDIIVSAPDKETLDIAKKYADKDKRIKVFQDPGKGKSYALNILFNEIKTDILILTDGDVYILNNVVEEIGNLFLDPEIGCISGRPVPVEDKNTKYGYWANFLFESAHRIRKKSFELNSFIECSGYLFAFRKNKIDKIPLDVAEDSIIPYYFWEKGYKIGYAEKAEVYVKNVSNLGDWIKQKTRTSKAHETLDKYVDTKTTKRVKTFDTEVKGIKWLFSYPMSFKEMLWSFQLALARAYMWTKVFADTKFANKNYQDAWEKAESTK